MAKTTYTASYFRIAGFSLLASLSVLTGCASEDMDDPMILPAPGGGFVADASAVTTADSGVAAQSDAAVVARPADAAVVLPVDTSVATLPDTSVVAPDTGVVSAEAGLPNEPGRADQGMGDGKDVVTIGDSWMNLMANVGIENSLERVSKRDYRNYGISGTKLLSGTNNIQMQYAKAKGEGAIKTVVMTGGGNDILQEKLIPCLDANFDNDAVCPTQIDAVAAGHVKLWAQMAADGVQDVLLVGYSNKTMPLGLGGTTKSIAYSNKKIPPLCAMVPAPLRCTILDPDVEVPNLKTRSDGIHPDDASYDAIGAAVWKLMQTQGVRR